LPFDFDRFIKAKRCLQFMVEILLFRKRRAQKQILEQSATMIASNERDRLRDGGGGREKEKRERERARESIGIAGLGKFLNYTTR